MIAILILGTLGFLFLNYLLSDGDLTDGIKRFASAGSAGALGTFGWIAIAAVLFFLLLVVLAALNHK